MKFPNLVYRCPGSHQCPGGTFDYHPVNDEAELAQLIKDGWYPTLPFAQDPKGFDLEKFLQEEEQVAPEVEEEPENSPDPHPDYKDLSRKDLEAKAKELGVGFSKNIKDETLAERIIQALEDEG